MDTSNRFRGCLLGLATGDAVGTTVEFESRGSFPALTDMIGGGPFNLKPGEWTDDTSMALCLATSLVELGSFDPRDQMERYWNWYQHGYLSSNGYCFDIGTTIRKSLQWYKETGNPYSGSSDSDSAGNGSIMRLAPVAIYYYPDREKVLHFSAESSRTTHGATVCLEACCLLGDILFRGLGGANKQEILFGTDPDLLISRSIQEIARGEYQNKSIGDIQGTGYVVKSLEAALWCFWKANSFEEAILMAANLGDDADTTAAVCGQVAGAFYGETGIPRRWLERLVMSEEIRRLADRLCENQTPDIAGG